MNYYCKEKHCNKKVYKKGNRCYSCSAKHRFENIKNHPCYGKKRDNYKCINCNMTQEEHFLMYNRDIEIHHIDYNKNNCNEDNLITLCKQCNIRANYNRDYWFSYYSYILENR